MEKKQYSAPRVTIFTAQLTSGLLAGSDPTLSGGLDKPGTDGGAAKGSFDDWDETDDE